MVYRIACVGRIKEKYFTDMIDELERDVNKNGRFEICEVPDERIPQKAGEKVNSMIIAAEGRRLQNVIGRSDYVIALCIDGKKTTTEMLRKQIQKADSQGHTCVTFVIGGSLGLSPEIIKMADYKMSVSNMTFPHQLMRAALVRQLAYL